MSYLTVAPYGAWRSPITAEMIAAGAVRLGQVQLDGADIYWAEGRPTEGGRVVVVRRAADGSVADVNPPPFNARTRVHEYGGGSYLPHASALYFANFADQRLYRQDPGAAPRPLTPEGPLRYADMVMDAARARLVCVCERHPPAGGEPENFLAVVPTSGGEPLPLARGRDFYAAPRLSPDGAWLVWMAWDHPHMPWDAAELWLAEVRADGSLGEARMVAGGVGDSVCMPRWSPDGTLYFVAERTGWWNLYRLRGAAVEAVCPMEAEFGVPHWVFGLSTYAFDGPGAIVCTYTAGGVGHLARIDLATGALSAVESPFREVDSLQVGGGAAVFLGAAPDRGRAVVRLDLATGAFEVLRRASDVELDPGYISVAQPVEFPTAGGLTAHGFFYPPRNKDFAAPEGERPPLLVMSHGGPTGSTSPSLSLGVQYWTSRGIAVLDVNYGGSTGYGRAYRERLRERWGIVDVDDCCNGARWLAAQGLVDSERMAITGGSAGGYTTLAALTFRDVFKAGASYYGVGDLEALARDTHKFESRYLDGLVGPYPERRDLYLERSPIHHVSALECPVVFFQGLEDAVVPPNQAEAMVAALRAKGVPVAYVPFPGEQHGFRKAENIRRALEGEIYFYSRVFGFELADPVEPLEIENLP
ncbi:MAG TPA: S9 family peptidase [Roseiflexaceae bacterium]|nr:S9 family peptidase [Roseiflexaceae bacterium]